MYVGERAEADGTAVHVHVHVRCFPRLIWWREMFTVSFQGRYKLQSSSGHDDGTT